MSSEKVVIVSNVNHHYKQYQLFGKIFERLKKLTTSKAESVQSLHNVSFEVPAGTCCGLLGANGAGKTTVIKLLSGLIQQSSGDISVLGFLPKKRNPQMLKNIGVLFGNRGQLIWDLSPVDTWELVGASYGLSAKQVKANFLPLAERLGVMHKITSPVRKLSLGERMKCELICAMIHKPKLLILDEPTIGLDAKSQEEIRRILIEEKANGTSIILTSHYMKDIEDVSDSIVFLRNGQVLYTGNIAHLIETYKPGFIFESGTQFSISEVGDARQVGGRWMLEMPRDSHHILNSLDFSLFGDDFSFRSHTLEEALLGLQEDKEQG